MGFARLKRQGGYGLTVSAQRPDGFFSVVLGVPGGSLGFSVYPEQLAAFIDELNELWATSQNPESVESGGE